MFGAEVAVFLFWIVASISAAIFIFVPVRAWPLVATRSRALVAFLAVFFITPLIWYQMLLAWPPPVVAAAPPSPAVLAQRAEQEARRHPEKLLDVSVTPEKDGIGAILTIKGEVANRSKYPIKDAVFDCQLYGQSGTQLGELKQTLFREFEPGSSENEFELNMGFANSQWDTAVCTAVNAHLVG